MLVVFKFQKSIIEKKRDIQVGIPTFCGFYWIDCFSEQHAFGESNARFTKDRCNELFR